MASPLLTLGILLAAFLAGAIPSGLMALRGAFVAHAGWNPERAERLLQRGFFLPLVLLLPVAGWRADLWGSKEPAVLGLVVVATGLALLALVPTPEMARYNLFGLGAGQAFLITGILSWMPAALASPGRDVEAMNLGFIPLTLGWLLGPWIVTHGPRYLGMKTTLLTGTVLAGVALITLGLADSPAPAVAAELPFQDDLRFWLLACSVLLYFPVEACVDVYARPFLRQLGGFTESRVRSRIFGFWFVFFASRLAAYFLVGAGLEAWFLVVCVIASAMVLGNLSGSFDTSAGSIGFLLLGVCYGPMLPGLLGLLSHTFPADRGLILGLLLAAAALYQVTLGPLFVRYARSHTPREAMRLPVVLTLLLAAPLFMVVFLK